MPGDVVFSRHRPDSTLAAVGKPAPKPLKGELKGEKQPYVTLRHLESLNYSASGFCLRLHDACMFSPRALKGWTEACASVHAGSWLVESDERRSGDAVVQINPTTYIHDK